MRFQELLIALGLPLLAAGRAAELDRFVSVSLHSVDVPPDVMRRTRQRARAVPETDLMDLSNAYLAEVYLGTPSQPVLLLIDSGSSWVWVNPVCQYARNQGVCQQAPRYDPEESSPPPQRVPALDGFSDYAGGFWAQTEGYSDVFSPDEESKIPNQAFGIASDSDGAYFGYLGLGPDLLTGFDGAAANYSVLNGLVRQKIINSRTFGLGLDVLLRFNSPSPGMEWHIHG